MCLWNYCYQYPNFQYYPDKFKSMYMPSTSLSFFYTEFTIFFVACSVSFSWSIINFILSSSTCSLMENIIHLKELYNKSNMPVEISLFLKLPFWYPSAFLNISKSSICWWERISEKYWSLYDYRSIIATAIRLYLPIKIHTSKACLTKDLSQGTKASIPLFIHKKSLNT